ncbi:MAG: hypothetical protein CML61_10115 [Rhodobacteraceae bacterium]|nr:hypothetical protein [Paracoccaceae bacterium]
MTTYRFASLDDWVTKVDSVMDAVVSEATSDALASVEIVPGITRGGSRVKGTIPRDLGALAASLQSSLYGSTSLVQDGQASYALVAGRMQAGDVASFSWGGPAAPYASYVHYGANGVRGTYWIDEMANEWPAFVNGAAAKAKAALR